MCGAWRGDGARAREGEDEDASGAAMATGAPQSFVGVQRAECERDVSKRSKNETTAEISNKLWRFK